MIRLDNGIRPRISPRVIDRMRSLGDVDGESLPHSPYAKGIEEEPWISIERCGETIRSIAGISQKEMVLISSEKEGVERILQGICLDFAIKAKGKPTFLTTPFEAPAILKGVKKWEPFGCAAKMAHLNRYGQLTKESLEEISRSSPPTLLTLSWANPFTGVMHPIAELASICHERGTLLHVDLGDLSGRFTYPGKCAIDFATLSGERIHGPSASGALFIRKSLASLPYISDISNTPFHLPTLVGLEMACREMAEHFDYLCIEIARLRNRFEEAILEAIPDSHPLFREVERLPHTSCLSFRGVPSELLAFHLKEEKIAIQFEKGGSPLQAHLKAIGVDPHLAQCCISVSLSRFTTEKEVRVAIEKIASAVAKCRALSSKVIP